ncbi:Uncharacterised protein [Vibrio cholerae]|nr:Uncharacterised protein [Vibrio cholerae]
MPHHQTNQFWSTCSQRLHIRAVFLLFHHRHRASHHAVALKCNCAA